MNRSERRQGQKQLAAVADRKAGVPPTTGRVRLVIASGLYLSHGGLNRMPSRWHRFWQRALLGWRWEALP
jgi:hypothetical protein